MYSKNDHVECAGEKAYMLPIPLQNLGVYIGAKIKSVKMSYGSLLEGYCYIMGHANLCPYII